MQNGGTKVATDRVFEACMSQENHRRIDIYGKLFRVFRF